MSLVLSGTVKWAECGIMVFLWRLPTYACVTYFPKTTPVEILLNAPPPLPFLKITLIGDANGSTLISVITASYKVSYVSCLEKAVVCLINDFSECNIFSTSLLRGDGELGVVEVKGEWKEHNSLSHSVCACACARVHVCACVYTKANIEILML